MFLSYSRSSTTLLPHSFQHARTSVRVRRWLGRRQVCPCIIIFYLYNPALAKKSFAGSEKICTIKSTNSQVVYSIKLYYTIRATCHHLIISLKLTDLDVNEDEKLVMQLWNHFLMSRRVISHAQLHQACKVSLNILENKSFTRNVCSRTFVKPTVVS